MAFRSFTDYMQIRKNGVGVKSEYLNDKGNLVEKPKVELIPDYSGPDPKSPPAGEKQGKPAPYKAANSNAAPKKGEKGFADKGDSKLVYEPKTDVGSSKNIPGGKDIGHYPKTKTEGFLEKTRGLSNAEFIQYMKEECGCGAAPDVDGLPMVNSYATGPFHPYPPEAIKYVVVLANKNDKILKDFVHEMKRSGGMAKLMRALFDHPESYGDLSDMFGDENDGPKHSKSFVKAMADKFKKYMDETGAMWEESVAPPHGLDSSVEDEEDSSMEDDPFNQSRPEDDEVPEDDEMGDEEHPEGEEDDEEMPPLEDDAGFDFDDESEIPKIEHKPKKLKKKFAHNHLLDSMASHDYIMQAMKSFMKA